MSKTFELNMITPAGQVFEAPIVSLVAPGVEGYFGVMARHDAMVVALKAGVVTVKDGQREKFFAIRAGVCEVHPDTGDVLILCDEAFIVESYDEAKEKCAAFN